MVLTKWHGVPSHPHAHIFHSGIMPSKQSFLEKSHIQIAHPHHLQNVEQSPGGALCIMFKNHVRS